MDDQIVNAESAAWRILQTVPHRKVLTLVSLTALIVCGWGWKKVWECKGYKRVVYIVMLAVGVVCWAKCLIRWIS
jgi:hypothetical protein